MAEEIKDITTMSEEELREKFTLDDLQGHVKRLELVEDPGEFNTKGQLISLLKLAGRKRPTSGPSQDKKDRRHYEKKKAEMRKRLKEQPQVSIFIGLVGDEKKGTIVERVGDDGKKEEVRVGAWLPVTLNGLRTWVPKGRNVDVPRQVSHVVGQHQSDTQEALSKYLIEGDKDKKEALAG